MTTATKSKRGTKLTPELQQQLTAYYPLIIKTAQQARQKYRRIIPEINTEDWLGVLTEAACRVAPCWDPSKGVFGTLLKVSLGNIIKNVLRDHTKPERSRVRGRQAYHDEMEETAGPDADVLDSIIARADFDEAGDLLDEIRSDLKQATRHADRLALVRDFLRSCNAEWVHRRPSVEIASLIGVTPAIVMRARGLTVNDPGASPETAPAAPAINDLPQVEDQVKMEPVTAPAPAPVEASKPRQHRHRFGLRTRPRRWLVAGLAPR